MNPATLEMSQIMQNIHIFLPTIYGSKPEQWKIDEDCKFCKATCMRQNTIEAKLIHFKKI